MRNLAVLLYYDVENKYSLNAVISCLDLEGFYQNLYLAYSEEELLEKSLKLAEKYDMLILGLSLMTTQLPEKLELIRRLSILKRRRRNVLLVAGGPHASGDPAGTLLSLDFDIAVLGEAEHTLPKLIHYLQENEDLDKVEGIVYRCNDELILIRKRQFLKKLQYPPFPHWRKLYGSIEISRGCPWGCKYCQVTYLHGSRMRHRDIENIIIHAKIFFKVGYRDLRFITPNAFAYGGNGSSLNYDALSELIDKLYNLCLSYGTRFFLGTFPSEVRPDFINEDTIRLIKGKVANKSIIIGAQSGSSRILKYIDRGHDVEDIINAVEVLRKHEFKVDVDFILGLPGETEEDIEETMKLIRKLINMGAKIHMHTFIPLPGTPFSEEKSGKIPEKIKKELYRLIGMGKLYGYWEKQEKLADIIEKYRREGLILGRKGWKFIRVK